MTLGLLLGQPKFSKTGSVWPLQAGFEQQCRHLWQVGQSTTDLHRNHLSDIFYLFYNGSCTFFFGCPATKGS